MRGLLLSELTELDEPAVAMQSPLRDRVSQPATSRLLRDRMRCGHMVKFGQTVSQYNAGRSTSI